MSDKVSEVFFEKINKAFKKIFIFLDKRNFYQNSSRYIDASFEQVEIMSFGHKKRDELYRKWFSVGDCNQELGTTSNELYSKIDRLSDNFDSLMKKNIIDSRPIYILTIIQTLENFSSSGGYSLTSYGQCYHALLVNMLAKTGVSIKNDLDGVLNFISYLAFNFYSNSIGFVTDEVFSHICSEYESKFFLIKDIKGILLKSGILYTRDNDVMKFSQKYLYYFCCANYISDHSDENEMQSVVNNLCMNMHNSNKANILIFLVHHWRSNSLLQEILTHACCLLDKIPMYDMSYEQTKHFKDFLSKELKDLVLEERDVEQERANLLKRRDEMATESREDFDDDLIPESEHVSFNIFQEATSAVKSIEVLGQIAKNRHSSLSKPDLKSIMTVTYEMGLKSLHFYMDIFKDSEGNLKNFIKSILVEKKGISVESALNIAQSMIDKICFSFCMYMIQLISKSTAHARLLSISELVSSEYKDSPAHQLIDLHSRLMIKKDIPKNLIKSIKKEHEKNNLVMMILKQLVISHAYLHDVDYRDKHWISDYLGIPKTEQVRIDSKKFNHTKRIEGEGCGCCCVWPSVPKARPKPSTKALQHGNTRLDRDKDGMPCESICGSNR